MFKLLFIFNLMRLFFICVKQLQTLNRQTEFWITMYKYLDAICLGYIKIDATSYGI